MKWNITDIKDKRFGRLVVLERVESDKHGVAQWKCKCDCGLEKTIPGAALRAGRTSSCGCLFTEKNREKKKPPFTAIYNVLKAAAARTGNPCDLTFEEYIEFTQQPQCHYCHETILWSPYRNKDRNSYMGYSLDRKDNAQGYSKENCVVCCRRCNHIKGNLLTYKQMLKVGPFVRDTLLAP